jgi:hypothetical protein
LNLLHRYLLPGQQKRDEDQIAFDDFMRGLGSTLDASYTVAEKLTLMQFGKRSGAANLARPTFFFRLVRHGPGDVVRPKTHSELTFSSADLGVTVHDVIVADASSKDLVVTSTPGVHIRHRRKSKISTCSFVVNIVVRRADGIAVLGDEWLELFIEEWSCRWPHSQL